MGCNFLLSNYSKYCNFEERLLIMSTVLMAEFDNQRQAKAASALLKKFGKEAKLMKENFGKIYTWPSRSMRV
jgi:hypothetical protein